MKSAAIFLSVSACFLRFLVFFSAIAFTARAQAPTSNSISLPTSLRVHSPGWWPTKGEAGREEYVGSEACFDCHEAKSERQQETAMFHAASRAVDSKNLRDHGRLTFQRGPFSYELATTAERSLLVATSGSSSVSAELFWAFGSAHMGQTFVYEQAGDFFESRVSFFTERSGLDVTPGPSSSLPTSIQSAAGRAMPIGEARACFACHTTAAITRNRLDPEKATPGVQCESCHGPGAKHVTAAIAKTDKQGSGSVFNPAKLNRVDSVDFCGACHRTWQDVVSTSADSPPLINVRFAPYRLENSQCWADGDARIACVGCHDPHKPLVHDLASYDANCLACHVASPAGKRTSVRPGASCPVATKNCVTCHMPKVEPPTLHSSFTDHWIRVAKAGTPYPE